MKNTKFLLSLLVLMSTGITSIYAQTMSKSYKTVKVERVIKAPADKVWQTMVGDYGAIANFAPSIYASNYENGSLKGEVGAQRKCYFNAKGDQWAHETIKELDNKNMVMKNILIGANKFPLDIDNSYAIYSVKDNGDGTSTAGYEFNFRTKPAIIGSLVKGQFKKQLSETLIGLDHYVTTGERVNATTGNWKEVKKKHS